MNILLNGTAIPEPAALATEWVTVAGVLHRQVTMAWSVLTAVQAASILGPASAASVSLSWVCPAANLNASMAVKIYSASCPVLREASGALTYAPLTITFREVLSP